MSFRKQVAFVGAILLFFQVVPLSLIHTYAETEDSIDPQLVDTFRSHQPEYLQLNQPMDPSEQKTEVVQEFSFVDKTFRTTVGQPVLLRFTSALPANEVLVRIPVQGQIVEEEISNEELIQHSHGEYWLLKTSSQQTDFVLPVIFETAGQYFLTIDHDADHFYLEVAESSSENGTIDSEVQKEPDLTDLEEIDVNDQKQDIQEKDGVNHSPIALQPVIAVEENLSIPDEVIAAEEARILNEITDPITRAATPRNWSDFRSAWNNRNTTVIRLNEDIRYSSGLLGSSSLDIRNTSVSIIARGPNAILTLSGAGNRTRINLEMNGAATLTIEDLDILGGDSADPIIKHNGSGLVEINNFRSEYSHNKTAIQAQNIKLSGRFIIVTSWSFTPAISLVRSGTLTITNIQSNSVISSSSNQKPIMSDSFSRIIINDAKRLTMAAGKSTPRSSWYEVNATLTGVNGSQVLNSESDPNDFEERYTRLFRESWYTTLLFNGSMVTPPRPSYALSLEASPVEGGKPTAETTTITQGETATLHANPTETFDFLRWEIVSGSGSTIADETSEVTSFTMGTSDTKVRATYQKKQGGKITVEYVDESLIKLTESKILKGLLDEEYEAVPIEIEGYTLKEIPDNVKGRFTKEEQTVTFLYTKDILDPVSPVDPLDPEKEVDPENPPELTEEPGLLSIDFASRFSFGQQGISAQLKSYYAQPQRLLNSDGTVNETEERPNYVQISDRRPKNERHGWTLSVTQNGQFRNDQNHELKGAHLQLHNQQLMSVQDIGEPDLSQPDGIKLIPGEKTELITARDDQGIGTWIYRFGDAASADKSVVLEVPTSATPHATIYQTTLTWELNMIPDN
ncbi:MULTISPECIES: WxL domain-containing protein [Enterococcus]|uniref:WxL domain-containing protein n=1 Tax=Enterococcus TaxID=1350 RepID=UPI0003C561C3|nr:WxL domain-containing protein [Enterococcus mundtii]BAO08564.1 hypothetical protein EMQU_3007 [Enterococcus mundtii QU 25]